MRRSRRGDAGAHDRYRLTGDSPVIQICLLWLRQVGPGRPGLNTRFETVTMLLWSIMRDYAFAARELVNPTYRPERHYMRGPGPACARHGGEILFDSRR